MDNKARYKLGCIYVPMQTKEYQKLERGQEFAFIKADTDIITNKSIHIEDIGVVFQEYVGDKITGRVHNRFIKNISYPGETVPIKEGYCLIEF